MTEAIDPKLAAQRIEARAKQLARDANEHEKREGTQRRHPRTGRVLLWTPNEFTAQALQEELDRQNEHTERVRGSLIREAARKARQAERERAGGQNDAPPAAATAKVG